MSMNGGGYGYQIGGLPLESYFDNSEANEKSSPKDTIRHYDDKCPKCDGEAWVFNPYEQGIPIGDAVCLKCGYREFTDLRDDEEEDGILWRVQ